MMMMVSDRREWVMTNGDGRRGRGCRSGGVAGLIWCPSGKEATRAWPVYGSCGRQSRRRIDESARAHAKIRYPAPGADLCSNIASQTRMKSARLEIRMSRIRSCEARITWHRWHQQLIAAH